MNTDGLILDIDGTLWDSTETVAKSYNIVFKKEGLNRSVTKDELKKLFGLPMDEIFKRLLPLLDPAERKRISQEAMFEENRLLYEYGGEFYEGVQDTIRLLSKRFPIFIASNCQKGYIEILLEKGGIKDFISDYLCFGDTGREKSFTIGEVIRRNSLKYAFYAGDTELDEEASFKAGIPCIYCSYGFGLMKKPFLRIEKFSDLEKIF